MIDKNTQESSQRTWLLELKNRPNYFLITDLNGKILEINNTFKELTKADVINTSIYDWMPKESQNIAKQKVEECIRINLPVPYRLQVINPKGELEWYEGNYCPISKDGVIERIVVLANKAP